MTASTWILDLQGTRSAAAMIGMSVLISLLLLIWGLRRFRRQRALGAVAMASALGPLGTLLALLVLLTRRTRHGLLAAAGAVAAVCGAAALVMIHASETTSVWLIVLAAHAMVAMGVLYASAHGGVSWRRLAVLMVLRSLAVLSLLAVLARPSLLIPPGGRPHLPVIAVLVDVSGSMRIADRSGGPSRLARLGAMLASQKTILEGAADVRYIPFADQPYVAAGMEDALTAGGTEPANAGSNLARALQAGLQAAEGQRLAGVLLLSDGIVTRGEDPLPAAREADAAIHAVAVGSPRADATGRANLRFIDIEAPLHAAVGHEIPLTVRADAGRLDVSATEVKLYEGDNNTPVASAAFQQKAGGALSARLAWTPPRDASAGDVQSLRVAVEPLAGETDPQDNSSQLHLLLTDPTLRVLYIEGTIRPEFTFLYRALERDPNIEAAALIRVAENRFRARGRIGDDVPTGLPHTREDFQRLDVLILGDLDRSFWSDPQLQQIEQFVSDGGGVVMLGGAHSFAGGGYGGTLLETILPVRLGPAEEQDRAGAFVPHLTGVGRKHMIFRGIAEYFPTSGEGQVDWPLPELAGCVRVAGAKPGASVLAVHPEAENQAGQLVVLAVQQYGTGRSAALTVDTTWKWILPLRAAGREGLHGRFWGQLIRWLGGAEPAEEAQRPAAVLRAERTVLREGEELSLRAWVQDESARGVSDARAELTMVSANAKNFALPRRSMQPSTQPGYYSAAWTPREAGTYRLGLRARGGDDQPLGEDALDITVLPGSPELQRLSRDDRMLKALAAAAGGRFVELASLPELVEEMLADMQNQGGPAPAATVVPLHSLPWGFAAFVVLLTAEWLLRRLWQMQ